MKNNKLIFFLFFICGFTLSMGQETPPTRAQMEAITMPPPRYDKTTDLTYVGDYGYYTVGSEREFSNTEYLGDANKWYWVRYKNPGNVRNIWAWASMGRSDVCGHGHISYGVWGKWQYNIGSGTYTGWQRLGMGTKSGEIKNNRCVWDVNNSLSSIGENFGWGVNYVNSNITSAPSYFKYKEYVVGSLAVSHGGYCDVNHCAHPTYTVLYSLP